MGAASSATGISEGGTITGVSTAGSQPGVEEARIPAPATAKRVREEMAAAGGQHIGERIQVYHHDCGVVMYDCMSSIIDREMSAQSGKPIPCKEHYFTRFLQPEYRAFFVKAAAAHQKCIYFSMPPAAFWEVYLFGIDLMPW